ncbi:ABC transporter ATP-binding protein [Microbacterium chocolatum]|uniref:ABC transporter ATP-binding protein n=1 Tax=Microbacterium aurantiacum TaxID=162393 RepID=UPI00338DE567
MTVDTRNVVLDVRDLCIAYGGVTAVADASFTLRAGEKMAIVGESGSGKTSLANAVSGFLDPLAGSVSAARLDFRGAPLDRSVDPRRQPRIPVRTSGMSMVFQDAMHSLDPVWTIGSQLIAVLRTTERISARAARVAAADRLGAVGIRDADRVMRARPTELSGGMRQRVMIAIAMASQPTLLIADEPTSALDATLAVATMQLMVDVADREGTALLMITHDIELCRRFTDTTVVMHRGRIVETISSAKLDGAQEEYTRGLLACVPTLETATLAQLPTLQSSALSERTAAA